MEDYNKNPKDYNAPMHFGRAYTQPNDGAHVRLRPGIQRAYRKEKNRSAITISKGT